MSNWQKGKRFVSTRWNRVHESISGLSNRKYQRRIDSSWVYWTTLWTARQPIQWQSCVNKSICNGCKTNLLQEKINMLFAGLGRSVWWKTVTSVQALSHSFSLYGPPSRHICMVTCTYMYTNWTANIEKLDLRLDLQLLIKRKTLQTFFVFDTQVCWGTYPQRVTGVTHICNN